MTNALVINVVEDGEVKQQTDMLHWINDSKAGKSLSGGFLIAWVLNDYCMPSPVSAQDSIDDLAMWCGQPM